MTAPFVPCGETPNENLDEPTIADTIEVNFQYAVTTQNSNPLTDSASEVKGHNHDVDLGHSATEVQESVLCVSDAIGETSQGVEDIGVLAEPDQISIVLPPLLSPVVEESSVPHSPAVQETRKFVFVDTSASKSDDQTRINELDNTSKQHSNADDRSRTKKLDDATLHARTSKAIDDHVRIIESEDTSVNPDLLISTTEAGESVPDNKTVHEKSSIDTEGTKTRGFPTRPRPVQVDILSAGVGGGRMLENREDSFEFEEVNERSSPKILQSDFQHQYLSKL